MVSAIENYTAIDKWTKLVAPYLSAMIWVPKRRGRLFFYDETDVCWCPDTGRIYQLPNAQAKIDSPGQNQLRYLLGSVEYPTGEGLYQLYRHKRNEEVQQHLSDLLEMCDGDFCFVVWDNASQHTTPMLWPFLFAKKSRGIIFTRLSLSYAKHSQVG